MKAGIIILNYNDFENTKKIVNKIKDYTILEQIIIVDNHSTDKKIHELRKLTNEKIVLLEAKENKGYSYGNNIGLKYLENNTNCEYVVISNPDIEVEEDTIKNMVETMKKRKDISFLGPTILELGKEIQGWKLPSFFAEMLSTMNFVHRYAKKLQQYEKKYYKNILTQVEAIHGSFFMARLKDFRKINYFDENTFLYYEENIIGKKCQQENLKIFVKTDISVTHALSQSVDKSLNKIKKYKILKKSMFYYEQKYNKRSKIELLLLKLFYYISLGISYITYWI